MSQHEGVDGKRPEAFYKLLSLTCVRYERQTESTTVYDLTEATKSLIIILKQVTEETQISKTERATVWRKNPHVHRRED